MYKRFRQIHVAFLTIEKKTQFPLKLFDEIVSNSVDEHKRNPKLNKVKVEIKYFSGEIKIIETLCRIDTKNELEYYKNGGILQYVLRNMI